MEVALAKLSWGAVCAGRKCSCLGVVPACTTVFLTLKHTARDTHRMLAHLLQARAWGRECCFELQVFRVNKQDPNEGGGCILLSRACIQRQVSAQTRQVTQAVRTQTWLSGESMRADMMTGWLMKAFNVSFYDDPRLCLIESCTPSMVAFKWDHAVCAL